MLSHALAEKYAAVHTAILSALHMYSPRMLVVRGMIEHIYTKRNIKLYLVRTSFGVHVNTCVQIAT